MTSEELQGNWKQMKSTARQHFGRLSDGDLDMIAGQREKLISKLQERYGYLHDEAQKKADEWIASASTQRGSSQPQQKQQQHMPPPPPPSGSSQQHTQKH